MFEVNSVERDQLKDFILNKHYAQRMPSISYSFGLFIDGALQGVLTIGKPASNALCEGVCGVNYKSHVFELNRLVVNEGLPKNTLSKFLSSCLRKLKKENLIIVSYADDGVGHKGYIYQATNWLYTGATKTRTDKYSPNGGHSRHYTDEYKHLRKYRTSKHRYVTATGSMVKVLKENLKYPLTNYPKGDNTKYTLGVKSKEKVLNTLTSEIFEE